MKITINFKPHWHFQQQQWFRWQWHLRALVWLHWCRFFLQRLTFPSAAVTSLTEAAMSVSEVRMFSLHPWHFPPQTCHSYFPCTCCDYLSIQYAAFVINASCTVLILASYFPTTQFVRYVCRLCTNVFALPVPGERGVADRVNSSQHAVVSPLHFIFFAHVSLVDVAAVRLFSPEASLTNRPVCFFCSYWRTEPTSSCCFASAQGSPFSPASPRCWIRSCV